MKRGTGGKIAEDTKHNDSKGSKTKTKQKRQIITNIKTGCNLTHRSYTQHGNTGEAGTDINANSDHEPRKPENRNIKTATTKF